MFHYEIVFMIHPDKENQINDIIDYYSKLIIRNSGKIHRVENWGNCKLAYPIKKVRNAYYILMNIEVDKEVVVKLNLDFRFKDFVIRSMIIKVSNIISGDSSYLKNKKNLSKIEVNSFNNLK